MDVNQQELDSVDKKLHKQNALAAGVFSALWSVAILIAWYYAFQKLTQFAPVFISISGVLIGLAVRLHGRGYTRVFSLIAFVCHAFIVFAAWALGLILGAGESIWGVFLLALYVIGAGLAMFIGRLQIPFIEHKAFYQLSELNTHASAVNLKNRWFLVLPLMLLLLVVMLSTTMFVLYAYEESASMLERENRAELKRDELENKAIKLGKRELAKLSTQEAMRHAFAFYSGTLFDEYGYRPTLYPSSSYKAQTILKYLVDERDHNRAKFVLGLLTINENGFVLIKEAADNGDIYARIYTATRMACNGQQGIARDLLTRLKQVSRDKYVLRQINNVLGDDFEDVCEYGMSNSFVKNHLEF